MKSYKVFAWTYQKSQPMIVYQGCDKDIAEMMERQLGNDNRVIKAYIVESK